MTESNERNEMLDAGLVLSSTVEDDVMPGLHNAGDAALIAACLEGNDEAWVALISRYSRLLFSIPLRFGFSETIAEEIFQETCLVLLEKMHTISQPERLSAWLVTVTRRACIQRLEPPEQTNLNIEDWDASLSAGDPPLDSGLIQTELENNVYLALQQLPPKCRELVEALFLRDPTPTYDEIAREFGIPTGSIGPYRSRCLNELRMILIQLEIR